LETEAKGVVVTDVQDGSTAQSFGLHKGDIVLAVNNAKIETTQDLVRVVGQPSRLWRLTIQRGGQQISAVVGG